MQVSDRLQAKTRGYIETFLWIRDKEAHIIPFFLNDTQLKILRIRAELKKKNRKLRLLILKSRRQGMTTLCQALNFHTVATIPNTQVATIAHDKPSTEKIFRISNLFYDKLDDMVRPTRLTAHNKRDMNFTDLNSLFYVGTAGSRGFGRGDTLQRVHWSEVAWSPGDKEDQRNLLGGIDEACSHGEVILESTPNGVGDLFHEKCSEARRGVGDWTFVFIPWWEDSDNKVFVPKDRHSDFRATVTEEEAALAKAHKLTLAQINWRRGKKAELKILFAQEYPEDPETCFLTSGLNFFNRMLVARLLMRLPDFADDGAGITIFENPKPESRYVIGSDVAEGLPHSDDSVSGVMDVETMRQVAVLRGKWVPEEFAKRTAELGKKYNTARIGVERNNHGHSMLNTLVNTLGYENLYFHTDYDVESGDTKPKLGWPTSNKTRPVMLDGIRGMLEDGHMEVFDRQFLEECNTFQKNETGKYEAREGFKDDSIFAWAIAVQVRADLLRNPTPRPSVSWV